MKNINSIKAHAEKLQQQNNYIRIGVRKLLEEWAEISECDEKIISDTPLIDEEEYICSNKWFLQAGHNEIVGVECGVVYDFPGAKWSRSVLPIEKLRELINNFITCADEIARKIKEKQEANKKIIDFLKKFE
jgi:hypothetical protein